MYLSQGIETLDGVRHPLLGLLPVWTRMCPRRRSLGYVEATLTCDTLWGRSGERLRGHEFHYSELLGVPTGYECAYTLLSRRSECPAAEGFQHGTVLASYAHLHFASRPSAVAHFVERLKSCIP
jgi:cobyrinic acid a,c-diamide synthase